MTNKTFGKRRLNDIAQGVAVIVIQEYENGTDLVIVPLACGYCDPLYSRTKKALQDMGFKVKPGSWSANDWARAKVTFPTGHVGYIRD